MKHRDAQPAGRVGTETITLKTKSTAVSKSHKSTHFSSCAPAFTGAFKLKGVYSEPLSSAGQMYETVIASASGLPIRIVGDKCHLPSAMEGIRAAPVFCASLSSSVAPMLWH